MLKDWHPGKLILLWLGAAVLLVLLLAAKAGRCADSSILLWAVISVPVAIATWRWFGYREGTQTGSVRNGLRGFLAEVMPIPAWLVWAILTLVLFATWANCSASSGLPRSFG